MAIDNNYETEYTVYTGWNCENPRLEAIKQIIRSAPIEELNEIAELCQKAKESKDLTK